jgi:quercetin dioxygenase-like cupin family protein
VEDQAERNHGHYRTTWAELSRSGLAGVVNARLTVGSDPESPSIWRTVFPPGCTVSPHTHDCDYAEIVLEGSQVVGRDLYEAGDIRVVKAGTVYGPLTAGPNGATVLVVMASSSDDPLPPRPGGRVTVGARLSSLVSTPTDTQAAIEPFYYHLGRGSSFRDSLPAGLRHY